MITDPRAQPARPIVMVGDVPVPIELPPPPVIPPPPLSLPSPAPLIEYAGTGLHAVWNDVWGWVSGTAKHVAGLAESGVTAIVAEVLPVVEAYVGQELKALSGFVNDAFDFAATVGGTAISYSVGASVALLENVIGIEGVMARVLGDVIGIDNVKLPALLEEIIRVGASIEPRILEGLGNVEAWAIDNIYHPLLTDVERLTHDVVVDVADTITNVEAWAQSKIDAETWARALAIAGVVASVGAITTWVEECGAPMCDMLGPKTDLGKFLKLLNLAGDAALIAELAALDGHGVEAVLRGLVSLSHGVIDDLDTIFTGGQTIGSAIAHAGG